MNETPNGDRPTGRFQVTLSDLVQPVPVRVAVVCDPGRFPGQVVLVLDTPVGMLAFVLPTDAAHSVGTQLVAEAADARGSALVVPQVDVSRLRFRPDPPR